MLSNIQILFVEINHSISWNPNFFQLSWHPKWARNDRCHPNFMSTEALTKDRCRQRSTKKPTVRPLLCRNGFCADYCWSMNDLPIDPSVNRLSNQIFCQTARRRHTGRITRTASCSAPSFSNEVTFRSVLIDCDLSWSNKSNRCRTIFTFFPSLGKFASFLCARC